VSERNPPTTPCPKCRGPAARATAGKFYPFCGQRCWALDLGAWLSEEYRVPEAITDEPGLAPPSDPEA
jgi:endogenous inhibitor of DNA gyrase (YacG/DUF329 family)